MAAEKHVRIGELRPRRSAVIRRGSKSAFHIARRGEKAGAEPAKS